MPDDNNARKPANAGPVVAVGATASTEKRKRRSFPGPRGAQASLRVAIDRSAHAEFISHSKESLDAEICGVLAGDVCEDDEGLFVHVQAVIRGAGAAQAHTQVTFTHETWNKIHQTLERDHPQLRIVGWYHSHPGFGVEFSDMDLFIQKNFFGSPTQIALVTDPLNGAVAICLNGKAGIEYLPRFWVDGREQECKVPARYAAAGGAAIAGPATTDDATRRIAELESRIGQLVLATDELRSSLHRVLVVLLLVACLAVIGVAGFAIYQQWKGRVEPPRNIGFAPVPVQVGDSTVMLGVQIVSWELPPELDVLNQAVEKLRRELQQQIQDAANSTNQPPAAPQP